ncbi:MAG: methionine synthase [Proteobacteria bacterium]|nr:methionine synthase [Pseudomonadota bacterium]
MNIRNEQLLIFDGACGSHLQTMDLPDEAWGENYAGYPEYLNLSSPKTVSGLHSSFLEAGANVIETNTFGANAIIAAEYGLENKVEEINHLAVEHARSAINRRPELYVAGSVGPTTKLPSMGHVDVREMAGVYATQIRALVEAGVDCLIIETCQDILQVKTALVTAFEILEALGRDIPVLVSVTVESTGTMLLGTRIGAVVAVLTQFPIFSLGLNCATGPEEMASHVAYLGRHWPGRISVIPNAGIPEITDGTTVFPLKPDDFATHLKSFVQNHGVSIVGGCCGTTPEHIRRLKKELTDITPSRPNPDCRPLLASLYDSSEIAQEIPPLIIGEQMNANGSRKFRKCLLADDFDAASRIGKRQEMAGAHLLDLSTAYVERDEKADLKEMIKRLSTSVRLPLVIDSTTPEAIEAALELYPGRAVVNSINLEDGGNNLDRVCKLAKKYGAAVIALAIGPDGMAMTRNDKLAVAKDIYNRAVHKHGFKPSDIFFDMLTFTIGSGDPGLNNAAKHTLEAIRSVKKELPGVFTILGVSNISFGLPRAARKVLNSMFLHEAIEAGLDAAIVDAGKILPVAQIPNEERKICLDLIYDRQDDTGETPLTRFIEHFKTVKTAPTEKDGAPGREPIEKQIESKIVTGDSEDIKDLLFIAQERYTPLDIINQILVPAMRRVGELFGRGEMLLPFVLKSAEVMKKSVDVLEPFMDRSDDAAKLKILLATVQGDVHDIGKNLVDIILSNNGFEVVNLGINVPSETIIQKAVEHGVDAIGLSGLLVKSAMVMKESVPLFTKSGLDVPILLGGAALTPRFVANSCAPAANAPVVYCRDAFEGLKAMQEIEKGTLQPTRLPDEKKVTTKTQESTELDISRDAPVPEPPFLGARYAEDIDPGMLFDKINKRALFRGRWGYRRAEMSKEEYADIVTEKVEPIFLDIKRRVIEESLAAPKVAYGYFRCFSDGNILNVEAEGEIHRFSFPRQSFGPKLCIADYFKSKSEGGDRVGFFVATLGDYIIEKTRLLYENDQYHDYLMLHGFAVELTDALAEYWHKIMRDELGIGAAAPAGTPVCSCQGTRYGFGYPSCPDLGAQQTVFDLLKPSKIGVALTENMEMVPEVSTSAIVVHHPQASYFSV